MVQLVSLVKGVGAEQVDDDPDRCAGTCGPVGECPVEVVADADMSDAGMSTVEYAVGTVSSLSLSCYCGS